MQKICLETQIDIPIKLLSNHSKRKLLLEILQDQKILNKAIMQLTGHRSVQGVQAYKQINKNQQLHILKP